MNRFPEKYEKPKLFSLDEGLNKGWTATCTEGIGPSTCSHGATIGKSDGFIDPEILQQGL